jgi:hypothetical protein
MQLFYSIFLTLFSALARASSYCTGEPSVAGYCTPETWEGRTTNGAPAVEGASGCEAACLGVASDAGDWFANLTGAAAGEKRSLVGYDCTFSIGRGPGQADPLTFSLANQDILDIYAGAIQRFAWDGRVAATGTMRCEGKEVAWWID